MKFDYVNKYSKLQYILIKAHYNRNINVIDTCNLLMNNEKIQK